VTNRALAVPREVDILNEINEKGWLTGAPAHVDAKNVFGGLATPLHSIRNAGSRLPSIGCRWCKRRKRSGHRPKRGGLRIYSG
jgi:hypothetical protein